MTALQHLDEGATSFEIPPGIARAKEPLARGKHAGASGVRIVKNPALSFGQRVDIHLGLAFLAWNWRRWS